MTNVLPAMDVIKTNKNKSLQKNNHNSTNKHDYPIYKELFFAYSMHTHTIFTKDITNYILRYCIALKNNDLILSKNPFITQWRYYCIPMAYYHLLRPQHIRLTQKLFTSSRIIIFDKNEYREHCILNSHRDYQIFVTLSPDLRLRLTQLPSSITPKQCKVSADTILIKKKSIPIAYNKMDNSNQYSPITNVFCCGYKQKPIIPEKEMLLITNKK